MQKMSEKEANELIDKLRDLANDTEVDMFCVASLNAYFEESADAIQTLLEEIQQYRVIGTVEELKELKYNGAFSGIELANIAASLAELQKYQAIGTVEECREAVERMKPKKPIEYEDKYYGCPKCGNALMHKWEKYPTILNPKSKGLPCCCNCLQVIDWSE